jgi:hypothetical protein
MTPNELRNLGEKAFGVHWQTALAMKMPCSPRTVRRWLSGDRSIGPMIEERIKSVCGNAAKKKGSRS